MGAAVFLWCVFIIVLLSNNNVSAEAATMRVRVLSVPEAFDTQWCTISVLHGVPIT